MTEPTDLFTWCMERAAMPPPPDAVPLDRLTDAATLDTMLASVAGKYLGGDPRAIASLWVKLQCRAVLAPMTAMLLRATRDGGPAPCPVGLVLQGGQPAGLALSPDGLADADALAAAMLRDHLAAVFDAIRLRTRLSPRVSWSNAGNLLEWALARFAADPRFALAASYWMDVLIIPRRNRFFPVRNPLHIPIRTVAVQVDGASIPHRQRVVCCLRDRLPGLPLCTTCPRLSPEALADLARRHGRA